MDGSGVSQAGGAEWSRRLAGWRAGGRLPMTCPDQGWQEREREKKLQAEKCSQRAAR